MNLISWNVNGLRAVVKKGFADIFASLDADIVCLQETKLQAGQIDLAFPGYHSYWNYAQRPGYSGTAVFTRTEPISVAYGMQLPQHDTEGRLITLEYDTFYLVCAYVPNSQDQLRRLEYRMQWEDDLRAYLTELDKRKPVVLCGDLNVAHADIDLRNPATNHRNPGFTDEERGKFTELLGAGFSDTFRTLHPDEVKYSWWSYRFHARDKNIGWRIDYFLASQRLMTAVQQADILTHITGSDHCPVQLTIGTTRARR